MAHSVTTAAVGRLNRRFLSLAFILATLSAVLVYAAISRSDGGGGSGAGEIPVVVAKAAIPAGAQITADMLDLRQIPQSDVGDQAFSTTEGVVGQVARYPIAANEQILLSKVVGGTETLGSAVLSHILEQGMRGMAITTSSVVGAGGLVLPGDHVDLLWVPGEIEEDHPGSFLVAENVEVLAVKQTLVDLPPTAPGLQQEGDQGTATSADGQRVRGSEAEPIPDATTLTLMVTPQQAQMIFCAEAGGTLRLAVRAFGDTTPSGVPPATCVLRARQEGG
jgi:Flp pilus assembly protein CpaB